MTLTQEHRDGCQTFSTHPQVNHVWFEDISFRGFPGELKSFGRTAAVVAAVEYISFRWNNFTYEIIWSIQMIESSLQDTPIPDMFKRKYMYEYNIPLILYVQALWWTPDSYCKNKFSKICIILSENSPVTPDPGAIMTQLRSRYCPFGAIHLVNESSGTRDSQLQKDRQYHFKSRFGLNMRPHMGYGWEII